MKAKQSADGFNLCLTNSNVLSTEGKIKQQAKISQLAMKARKSMPKDYKSFCLVTAHLIRNEHRYWEKDLVESLCEAASSVQQEDKYTQDEAKDINKMLRGIRALKRQNRITEQQASVVLLKDQYGTNRKISEDSGVPLKMVHS